MKNFLNRKLNRKGFTLIEMLVSFAILGIVILMVGGFMVQGSRLYTKVNAETNLQEESQMALNQAENIIIDAGLGVNYGVIADGTYNFFDKDPSGTLTNKILYVFNYDASNVGVKALMIGYSARDKTLYYKEVDIAYGSGATDTVIKNMPEADPTKISVSEGWDILAVNVSNFKADLEDYKAGKDNRVTLSITLFKTNDESSTYTAEGTVTLRNTVEINAETISKIFSRVSIAVQTNITGVDLTMASYTVVKDEVYQLYTKVTASSGYPSQEIAWYDIFDDATGQPATGVSVNKDTKELKISRDVSSTTLRVYAYAATGRAKAEDVANGVWTPGAGDTTKGIYTKDNFEYVYDYCVVSIKNITDFYIQPDRSKTTTVKLSNNWETQSRILLTNLTNAPVFNVEPGNTFYMTGLVTGTGLDTGDTDIEWSIENPSTGVTASISTNGFVEISKFSKSGTFYIVANPKIQSSNKICYKVQIGNDNITSQSLQLKYNDTMNRGGSQTLALTMNGIAVTSSELSDFTWTKSIKINGSSTVVSESNLTLTGANLTVSTSLAYEYSYVVTVRAELKNDPSVFAERTISVPKVTLRLTPSVYYADRNSTIDYGKIKCVVTGIENYTLNWTIASRTNPNIYSTATNNNSYVSVKNGERYKNTALVHISSNEPAKLEYIRLKATINGHTNYSATSKINLSTKDGFSWQTPQTTSVKRGEKVLLNISSTASDFNTKDVEWEISAKKNGQSISTDGLSVDDSGYLVVDNDYELTESEITVTVKPTWAGLTVDAKNISISGVSFNITGENTINRGGSKNFTITGGYPYADGTLRWTYTLNGNEPSDDDGVTLSTNGGTATVSVDKMFDTTNGNNVIAVFASASTASGKTITSEAKNVNVSVISISLSNPNKESIYSYSVNATVNGFENSSDYFVDWSLNNDFSNTVSLFNTTGLTNTVSLSNNVTTKTIVTVSATVRGFNNVVADKEISFIPITFRDPSDLNNNNFDKRNAAGNEEQSREYNLVWHEFNWNNSGWSNYNKITYKMFTDESTDITYLKLIKLHQRDDKWKFKELDSSVFERPQYWAKYQNEWYKYDKNRASDKWVKQNSGPYYNTDMGF